MNEYKEVVKELAKLGAVAVVADAVEDEGLKESLGSRAIEMADSMGATLAKIGLDFIMEC